MEDHGTPAKLVSFFRWEEQRPAQSTSSPLTVKVRPRPTPHDGDGDAGTVPVHSPEQEPLTGSTHPSAPPSSLVSPHVPNPSHQISLPPTHTFLSPLPLDSPLLSSAPPQPPTSDPRPLPCPASKSASFTSSPPNPRRVASRRSKPRRKPLGKKMGIYLSTPKTEKFSEDGGNNKLRYGLSSMQGWRATMEDAHAALPDLDDKTSFFGVYDGHGGKVVAKFCAKYLHTQVLKNEAFGAGDFGGAIQKAYLRMDEMMKGQRGWRELSVLGDKINKFTGMIEGFIWSPRSADAQNNIDDWAYEEGPHSDFSGPSSGCTACVAVIRGNQLIVANAGDSRCVISRGGQAYNLSKDHKPDLEGERERILRAGGFIHAGRVNGSLNLARAIGDMEFKQNKFLSPEKQIVTANPDINIVELCDDDEFLVLACDGIWDCMSSQQVVDFIREHIKSENLLSAVCEKLLDRCLAPSTACGEGCDNMTVILVQFNKPAVGSPSNAEQSSPETSKDIPVE